MEPERLQITVPSEYTYAGASSKLWKPASLFLRSKSYFVVSISWLCKNNKFITKRKKPTGTQISDFSGSREALASNCDTHKDEFVSHANRGSFHLNSTDMRSSSVLRVISLLGSNATWAHQHWAFLFFRQLVRLKSHTNHEEFVILLPSHIQSEVVDWFEYNRYALPKLARTWVSLLQIWPHLWILLESVHIKLSQWWWSLFITSMVRCSVHISHLYEYVAVCKQGNNYNSCWRAWSVHDRCMSLRKERLTIRLGFT